MELECFKCGKKEYSNTDIPFYLCSDCEKTAEDFEEPDTEEDL